MTKALLCALFAALCYFSTPVESCSCIQATFFQHVQKAKVLLRVWIVAGPYDDSDYTRYYVARVQQVHKDATGQIDCQMTLLLRTSQNYGMCGATYNVDQSYLISGFHAIVQYGIAIVDVSACGLSRLWCSLQQCEVNALKTWSPRCTMGSVCWGSYPTTSTCAACGQEAESFANGRAACLAGYKVVDGKYCTGCAKGCDPVYMICRWGSPACCSDGVMRCPYRSVTSGSITTQYFSCSLCSDRSISYPSTPAPKSLSALSSTDTSDLYDTTTYDLTQMENWLYANPPGSQSSSQSSTGTATTTTYVPPALYSS